MTQQLGITAFAMLPYRTCFQSNNNIQGPETDKG